MGILKKFLVSVLIGFIFMISFSSNTKASELPNPSVKFANERIAAFGKAGRYFDYVTYANTYPDLALLYGYNKADLWKHYSSIGVYENRVAIGTVPNVTARVQAYNIVSSITNDYMSERDKARSIHDWIVNNTQYDYANYLCNTIPDISYTKEGVLLNHTAVCSGYADAFSYLAKLAGLYCENVDGLATSNGSVGGHAWNRVMIDGTMLYIDCTWDDPVSSDGSNVLRYDYFLVPYEVISANHVQQSVYKMY